MYRLMDKKVKQPIQVNLDKDRVYFWCTCGLSNKQPMCDGSHKGKSEKKNLKVLELKRRRSIIFVHVN